MGKKQINTQKFLHQKREQARLQRLWKKGSKNVKKPRVRPYLSSTVKAFRDRLQIPRRPKKNQKTIVLRIPRSFSVLDDPGTAIQCFYRLVEANERYERVGNLYFDHSQLERYDLAAEKVLDHLADEIRKERRVQKRPLHLQGRFPASSVASRFIRGIGIIRTLGLQEKYLPDSERDELEVFDRFDDAAVRVIRRSSQQTSRDLAVEKFTDHINNCLKRNGYKLTTRGAQDLGVISGEVLDNAVEHSAGDGWVIAGYLDTKHPDNMCEIAIFNVGKSIAHSFSVLPPEHFTKKLIQPYIDAHVKKRIFGKNWTEDDLLTVIALQENISSKNNTERDTRGSGTVDLIQFFQKVYELCGAACDAHPKMAILSGNTHIVFDGTYVLRANQSGREIIAFNSDNDLNQRPDPNYVTRISGLPFPGTAVCIRFPMQDYQYETSPKS